MRKYIEINKSEFPIVTVTYQPFTPTMEEFLEMQDDLEKLWRDHKQYITIIDLTHVSFLPAEMRIKQGEWSKKNDHLIKESLLGLIFLVPSLTSSLMLKGVFLIQKPSAPHLVTRSIEEARKWAKEKLLQIKK